MCVNISSGNAAATDRPAWLRAILQLQEVLFLREVEGVRGAGKFACDGIASQR